MKYKVYFRDATGHVQHVEIDSINLHDILKDLQDQRSCAGNVATAIQQAVTMPILAVIK